MASSPTSATEQFLLAEYQSLRKEVEFRLDEIKHIESFGLGGVFGLMAWLVTNAKSIPPLGWSLPCLFAFACAVRVWAVGGHFFVLAEYFIRLERWFLPGIPLAGEPARPEPCGWTRYYWSLPPDTREIDTRLAELMQGNFTRAHVRMWMLTLVMVVAFGLLGASGAFRADPDGTATGPATAAAKGAR